MRTRLISSRMVQIRAYRQCAACGWVFHPESPMLYCNYRTSRGDYRNGYLCICCASFISADGSPHSDTDFFTDPDAFPQTFWSDGGFRRYYNYWVYFWSRRDFRYLAPILREIPETSTQFFNQPIPDQIITARAFNYRLSVGELPRISMRVDITNAYGARTFSPGQPVYVNVGTGQITAVQQATNDYVIGYVTDVLANDLNTAEPYVQLEIRVPQVT